MGLKDKLKHFKDFDGYSGSLSKADMDNNLDLLADEIDKRVEYDPQLYSIAFGESTASANYSEAFGEGSEASEVYSYARGYRVKASAPGAQIFGGNIENKQPSSIGYGAGMGNVSNLNIRSFDLVETTDGNEKSFYFPVILWKNSINYILIKCEAIDADISNKWIFERKLVVRVDGDGNVTVDSDNNTDIVKDDSDWDFKIEATNGDNPSLSFKAVGKDGVNIAWGIEREHRQTYWN